MEGNLPPPKSKGSKVVTALALICSSLLLAAGALELALSWRHESWRETQAYRDLCTRAADDPRLVYTLIPGRCDANSAGYRDRERRFEKPEGVRRLVVIGDSVAAGVGVSPGESFGEVVEQELERREAGRYEVIRLARTGYSTAQELVLLEREAGAYDPDLILWSYVLNDPAHPTYHDANGELGRYHHRPTSRLVQWLKTRFFRLRERVVAEWRCRAEYHARLHCVYADEIEANLDRLAELASDIGSPILFVLHPVFEEEAGFADYSLREVHEQLLGSAAAHGFEFLDLLGDYAKYDPFDLKRHNDNWFDPWHPSAFGHRVAADAILHRLESLGFIAAPRESTAAAQPGPGEQ